MAERFSNGLPGLLSSVLRTHPARHPTAFKRSYHHHCGCPLFFEETPHPHPLTAHQRWRQDQGLSSVNEWFKDSAHTSRGSAYQGSDRPWDPWLPARVWSSRTGCTTNDSNPLSLWAINVSPSMIAQHQAGGRSTHLKNRGGPHPLIFKTAEAWVLRARRREKGKGFQIGLPSSQQAPIKHRKTREVE